MSTEFVIRNSRFSDIPSILNLARCIGRMVGFESELLTWMKVDPEGIFVALRGNETLSEDIIGVCSGMCLSAERGFIGLYMVREDCRGSGLGSQLWSRAMRHLGDRNIGVCGDKLNMELYRTRSGFSHVANFVILYYEYSNTELPIDHILNSSFTKFSVDNPLNFSITSLVSNDHSLVDRIVKYDSGIHRYDRSVIVTSTIAEPSCQTKIAVLGDTVVGYACVKPVITGHKLVAPIYAESQEIAKAIMRTIMSEWNQLENPKGIIVRFPDINTPCRELMEGLGFKKWDLQILSAYNKKCIDIPVTKIFAFQSVVFCTE